MIINYYTYDVDVWHDQGPRANITTAQYTQWRLRIQSDRFIVHTDGSVIQLHKSQMPLVSILQNVKYERSTRTRMTNNK